MLGALIIQNVKLKINNAQLKISALIILCSLSENVFSRSQFMKTGFYCEMKEI